MKKLKLQFDELAVETFATAERTQDEGTVLANAPPTRFVSCYLTACPLDCTNGFLSECCTFGTECCTDGDTCNNFTCAEVTCVTVC